MDGLRAAVERERPGFLRRLEGPVQVEVVRQRWFARHRIFAVASPLPLPATRLHIAVAREGGDVIVLSGLVENLRRVAAADPPRGIGSAARARLFVTRALGWIDDGGLEIASFTDIPWRAGPDHEERIDVLRRLLADRIHPPRVSPAASGHLVCTWVLDRRRLILREVLVPRSGQLEMVETIVERDLPC